MRAFAARIWRRVLPFIWTFESLIRFLLGMRQLPARDQLLRVTVELILPPVVDNVFRENPLLRRLRELERT